MDKSFVPKHNLEAEQSLLWCILIDWNIINWVLWQLTSEMFYDYRNKYVFEAMIVLAKQQVNIDMITIKTQLEQMDQYDPTWKKLLWKINRLLEIWWITYLVELTEIVPSTLSYNQYADIIYEDYTLRRINDALNFWLHNIHNNNLNSQEVLKLLESSIRKIVTWKKLWEIKKIQDILVERMEEMADLDDFSSEKILYSWFESLDSVLWPLMWGNLVVVWWRPWSGKSVFAMNLVNNAIRQDKRIAMFSMEMNEKEIINRFISMNTNIDSFKLKNWKQRPAWVSKEDFEKMRYNDYQNISEKLDYLMQSKFFLDTSSSLTINKIKSRLSLLTLQEDLDLVVIDYLWLIKHEWRWDTKANQIAEITSELKRMAQEFDCPIVLLSQLSRKTEDRIDKRPLLSDLKDSGAIEQDANIVLFLYREAYYDKDTDDKSLEVTIAKSRDWIANTKINLFCDLSKQYIRDATNMELFDYWLTWI